MRKHTITLWTDELVYTRWAILSQYERYCVEWRNTFIKFDASTAQVYLTAIEALREALKEFDKVMQGSKEQ